MKIVTWILLVSAPICADDVILSLSLMDWVDNAYQQCLTIADINSLTAGTTIKILVIDRNFADVSCQEHINTPDIAHDPIEFFRYNTALYTHHKDLQGTISWMWNDDGIVDEVNDFEFHIEYLPGLWYPLHDGHLPETDPDNFFPFPPHVPRKWQLFPLSTCIGFRGPMLRWEIVDEQPRVYWRNEY